MITNIPFLLRFATPLASVREPEGLKAPGSERNAIPTESSLSRRGDSRFTRVRNETTDDE
jgi:hypothetical protein